MYHISPKTGRIVNVREIAINGELVGAGNLSAAIEQAKLEIERLVENL
jgi:hypothetical protein